MRSHALVAALVLALPAMAVARPVDDELRRSLDELRSLDERITVVMESGVSDGGAPGGAQVGTGWALQARKTEVLETVDERIRAQLAVARPLPTGTPDLVHDFLAYVRARGPGIGDLVYDEVADHIETSLDDATALPGDDREAYRRELGELRSDLDRIRRELGAEVGDPAASLEHAAPAPRPRWDAYVRKLQKATPLQQLLDDSRFREGARDVQQSLEQRSEAAITDGSLGSREVVITLDDGPSTRYTPTILDTLAQHGVHATFFQVGSNVGSIRDGRPVPGLTQPIERRILKEGHTLANHSYSHPLLTRLGEPRVTTELGSTSSLLEAVDKIPTLFRPPYGAFNATVREVAQRQHLTIVLWSVDSQDWRDKVPESIVRRTMGQIRSNGRGIVLMHDIHPQTASALPTLLAALDRGGYRVVPLTAALR